MSFYLDACYKFLNMDLYAELMNYYQFKGYIPYTSKYGYVLKHFNVQLRYLIVIGVFSFHTLSLFPS